MRVYVVVCQQWLRGEHTVAVVGAYREEEDAHSAIQVDQLVDCEALRFGYEVVEVEAMRHRGRLASRWERAWQWLEGWVHAAPWPRV